ncbi:hypothetical protein [Winogradskya humida]|uniref:Uncharacterized protein n=1 Tax=Winogradskya humida TaxID=113566 RepID=A0ABQ3ZIN7_9ACTN|nr:hypothetical protein [Actinoplanes humidus]GIE18353.1 hypothetical protein Ahu01nite_014550 [Actinoplanes humidus]
MAESQMNFGDMNFHGGQQNIGNHNTNTQNNNTAPADEVRDLLTAILGRHPQPAYAQSEVAAIKAEIAEGTPQARGRLQTRLQSLAESAGSTRTVVEAAAAIGVIVAANWPL